MDNEKNDGVNLTPEQITALKSERDAAIAAKTKLTEDLLYEKKKKQEAEEKLLSMKPTVDTSNDVDVEKLIDAKLRERDSVEIEIAKEEALNDFLKQYKEYDPSIDTTGLRLEVLKKEVSKFNLSGARKKEDFLDAFNDAQLLIKRKNNQDNENPYTSSPSNSGGAPAVTNEASLSSNERATMKRLGWDLNKFNDMKLKHPDLFSSIFK